MGAALAAFTLAAAVLTMTPGLDTAIVLRAAAGQGARAGMAAALGVVAGLFVWGAGAAFGLGALLAASHAAYAALKWTGAAYLAFVGLKLLFSPRRALDLGETGARGGAFRRGLLTNLLNPKIGVFYATFLPQFIPAGVAVAPFSLALTAIHAALGLIWFAALIALTAPLGRWLRRPAVVAAFDRATGAVFLGFGAKLAWGRG